MRQQGRKMELTIGDDELSVISTQLESNSAEQRVAWALAHGEETHVLTTSFGAQAAVALHLLTTQKPTIPVVLVDTGYLFPETYQFADSLTKRLNLNLKIYTAQLSCAWMEARYGRLWEQGLVGIERYNLIRKVEPLRRALVDVNAGTWFTGLRRSQAESRRNVPILERRNLRLKVNPIADWNDKDVWTYLKEHGLPYHPLWEEGYASIGDVHSTQRMLDGMTEEETRFFGLKRECGIHEQL